MSLYNSLQLLKFIEFSQWQGMNLLSPEDHMYPVSFFVWIFPLSTNRSLWREHYSSKFSCLNPNNILAFIVLKPWHELCTGQISISQIKVYYYVDRCLYTWSNTVRNCTIGQAVVHRKEKTFLPLIMKLASAARPFLFGTAVDASIFGFQNTDLSWVLFTPVSGIKYRGFVAQDTIKSFLNFFCLRRWQPHRPDLRVKIITVVVS